MFELICVTKGCIPKGEGKTHLERFRFAKLWQTMKMIQFLLCIDPQTIMVKGGWNILGHPHENTNSLPSGRLPRAQSCQTVVATLEESLPGRRIPRFQWRLKLLNSGRRKWHFQMFTTAVMWYENICDFCWWQKSQVMLILLVCCHTHNWKKCYISDRG